MKYGDKVKVFEDPLTQMKLEGEAVLGGRGPGHPVLVQTSPNLLLETWNVRFPEDDGLYLREVLVHFVGNHKELHYLSDWTGPELDLQGENDEKS